MKKILLGIGILAILIGIGIGFFFYTNIQKGNQATVVEQTLDDQVLIDSIQNKAPTTDSAKDAETGSENETESPTTEKLKVGSFGRFDSSHYAYGEATIYQTAQGPVLKFEPNFASADGPDLFVYLATESDITGIRSPRGEEISLGKLKQLEGEQVYQLPEDYEQYNSVVIWCRAFDVNFSAATLENI